MVNWSRWDNLRGTEALLWVFLCIAQQLYGLWIPVHDILLNDPEEIYCLKGVCIEAK